MIIQVEIQIKLLIMSGAVDKVLCVALCLLSGTLCNNLLRTYTENTEVTQSLTEKNKIVTSSFSTYPVKLNVKITFRVKIIKGCHPKSVVADR
jgi:hypothetical protein